MKITFVVVCILFFNSNSTAGLYQLKGNFSAVKSQTIRLIGFNGLGIYTIDSTKTNEQGSFSLTYSDSDLGMGYITATDNKPYFVVLEKENIELSGALLTVPETVGVVKGYENKAFVRYANDHAKREQALGAWNYLEKIYKRDSLFFIEMGTQKNIRSEIQRIQLQDNDFLSKLAASSYMRWYLPLRKLISSVSTIAQNRTEEIPATISAFRKIDYADPRLYKSGLLKDAVESHYWLLENRGLPLDSIFKDMDFSTDRILQSISKDEKIFNETVKFLFDYFEKHSLFESAEHLALEALTQQNIPLYTNLSKQLETYRKLKKGNTAPDIFFSGDVLKHGIPVSSPNRLSTFESNYKMLIFGASWCSACSEQMAQLLPLYEKWKTKGVEVIFVSLDTDKKVFQSYTSVMPFISFCDYKKWDTQAAKDYFVYSSPTLYFLDKNNKIILRPQSVKALDSWVDVNIK